MRKYEFRDLNSLDERKHGIHSNCFHHLIIGINSMFYKDLQKWQCVNRPLFTVYGMLSLAMLVQIKCFHLTFYL